jgi:hypothetical protein
MGRPAGIPNKASGAVKEVAQRFGLDAIQRLADLAGLGAPGAKAESETAQIVAIKELLDRGYGRATQPISGEDGGPVKMLVYTGVHRHGDPSDPDTGTDPVGR